MEAEAQFDRNDQVGHRDAGQNQTEHAAHDLDARLAEYAEDGSRQSEQNKGSGCPWS
jgi:hypothetical protein